MCNPPRPESQLAATCGETCTKDPQDQQLESVVGDTVEYARFCLYACVPQNQDEVGLTCMDIPKELGTKAETSGGNGEDPAEKMLAEGTPAPKPEPEAEAAEEAAAEESSGAGGADAAEGPKDPGRIVAAAAGKEAQAAAIEARTADAEAKTKRLRIVASSAARSAVSAARAALTTAAELTGEEEKGRIWAHQAAKSQVLAARDLEELRAAAAEAAREAGAEAAAQMQKKADEAVKEAAKLKAKFNPPKPKTAEAANRVMAPYNAAAGRALGVRQEYINKAQELSTGAADLQRNARILAAQAAAYQSAGNTGLAGKMMGQAKGMISQATALDGEAQKYQGIAATITKQIPTYQYAAAVAAIRATDIANPAGQPPPPLPMLVQLGSNRTLE